MIKFYQLANKKIPGLKYLIRWIFRIKRYEAIKEKLTPDNNITETIDTVLTELNVHIHYEHHQLDYIPKSGPLIIVANHPFGGLDGLIIAHLLLMVRTDVKVLVNYFLQKIPFFDKLFIGINPYETEVNTQTVQGFRETIQWLQASNTLIVFPSGDVSTWRYPYQTINDPAWHKSIARLAITNKATVLPIYVAGRNSWYFYLAGLISTPLRSLLLPQQLLAKQNAHVEVVIGQPISSKELLSVGKDYTSQIHYLRFRTYLLAFDHTKARHSKEEKHKQL